ncbi:MAG: hypothetical protein GY722_15430 [bacterium]|nr:hypothetical protein [bacterium]
MSADAYLPSSHGEFIGVTGIAFHPDFLKDFKKRHLYVRFNRKAGGPTSVDTVIRRYLILPGTMGNNFGQNNAPQDVYTFNTESTSHGSGTIMFDTRPGREDFLYVPMPDDSDAAAGLDCLDARRAQDPGEYGKLLQIDTSDVSPTPTFPVVQVGLGLRNPFFFSVDRGDPVTGNGQGDIWIGDVGQMFSGSVFRFNPATGGQPNFGWPWQIGDGAELWIDQVAVTQFTPCVGGEPNPPPMYETPFLVFSDASEFGGGSARSAIVGGYAYRGTNPAFQNRYFFASYSDPGNGSPRLFHVDVGYVGSVLPTPVTVGWANNYTIRGMGQDWAGELYVIRVNEGVNPGDPAGNGEIYKIQ